MSQKPTHKPAASLQPQDERIHAPPASSITADPRVFLRPHLFCETRGGEIAFSIGRMRFRGGRPMLVEHLGGLFLEHTLCGRVLTQGYGSEYDIMHVFADEGAMP